MKIISVLILVIAGCGFFGYYKHLQEKEASLIRMKKEIEEKKLELKRKEELRRKEELEAKRRAEARQTEIDKLNKHISEEEKKLGELTGQLKTAEEKLQNFNVHSAAKAVPLREITQKIRELKREIALRQHSLDNVKRLARDSRYVCYDMCVYNGNIKFERRMTHECRSVVPGGIYYCLRTRKRSVKRLRGTSRRDRYNRQEQERGHGYEIHNAKVYFVCSLHNIKWNEQDAAEYKSCYIGSSGDLALSQKRVEKELDIFYKELDKQQQLYDNAKQNNSSADDSELRTQIRNIKQLIRETETNIDRLKRQLDKM